MGERLSQEKIMEALDNRFVMSQRRNPNKKERVGLFQQFKDMWAILKEQNNGDDPDLDEAISQTVESWREEDEPQSLASGYSDEVLYQEATANQGSGQSLAEKYNGEGAEEEPEQYETSPGTSRQMDYKPAAEQRPDGDFVIDRQEDREDLGGDNEDGGRIRAVQEALSASGYDIGPDGVTGVYNKETETAVKLIQKMTKREPNGKIDKALFEWLVQ